MQPNKKVRNATVNEYDGITFRSKLVTDTISPLGSEKRYIIESGNLKKLYVSDYGKKLLWVDEKFKTKDEALDFIKDEKHEDQSGNQTDQEKFNFSHLEN